MTYGKAKDYQQKGIRSRTKEFRKLWLEIRITNKTSRLQAEKPQTIPQHMVPYWLYLHRNEWKATLEFGSKLLPSRSSCISLSTGNAIVRLLVNFLSKFYQNTRCVSTLMLCQPEVNIEPVSRQISPVLKCDP